MLTGFLWLYALIVVLIALLAAWQAVAVLAGGCGPADDEYLRFEVVVSIVVTITGLAQLPGLLRRGRAGPRAVPIAVVAACCFWPATLMGFAVAGCGG